ncbi:transglycosylase SLT domain-containing protein [Kocuria carniphila]|uniref:transglycosylase SLT domain-containing protein n=1 Tax=Kocuria carniphila TaxID=262208 RepID=UPI0034DABAA4
MSQKTAIWGIVAGLVALLLGFILFITLFLAAIAEDEEQEASSSSCAVTVSASKENGDDKDGDDKAEGVPNGWGPLVDDAAKEAGLPASIAAAQLDAESNWDPNAGSSAGAQGIAQFIPDTWAKYGNGGDIHDPEDSIAAYGRYMKDLKSQVEPLADGDANELVRLTLAAYNAGPGAVQEHNGVPPYPETQNYIKTILGGGQDNFSANCEAPTGAKAWDGDLGDGEWTMPIPGGSFTSGYGPRNVPGLPAWAQNHVGVDISAGGGAPIIAPADMTVVGTLDNDHCVMTKMNADPGFGFAFCHLRSLDVDKGTKLKRGDEIGTEGGFMGGNPNGAADHLHLELYKPNCGGAKDGGMNTPYDGCNLDPQPILKEKGAWP